MLPFGGRSWSGQRARADRPAISGRYAPGSVPVPQPGGDGVPDHVGERGLRARRNGRAGAVGAEQDRLGVVAAEHLAGADVVDDQQVAALAGQLGPAVVEHVGLVVAGLGGEAHDHRASAAAPRCRDQLGQDVGVLLQRRRPAPTRRRPS